MAAAMTSKLEGAGTAHPRESQEESRIFVSTISGLDRTTVLAIIQSWRYLHLGLVGIGSVVPGAVVLGFSPWFRRWNPLITRRDVFRKVVVTASIGGLGGYVMAASLAPLKTEDESRHVMRKVRKVLYAANKQDFMASHPPHGDTVIKQSRPSGDCTCIFQANVE